MLRRSAATAAAALLALAPPLRGQGLRMGLVAGSPDAPVDIEADRITYSWEGDVLHLDGHVVARREGGIVRASSGTLDRKLGLLLLTGGVLGVQGKQVFMADSASIDLNAHTAELRGPGQSKIPGGLSVLYLKTRSADPGNPMAGANSLILRGERVRQLPDGHYAAEEVRLTPCDCVGEPDYELLAHAAELDEDRAHLSGTRLHMLGVTVPLFPLALPLTQRQWGLLAPAWDFNGTVGFTYAQPVYFPLGDSYDATVTPGYYTGGPGRRSPALGSRTVRGPRFGTEFRYAPVQGTSGSLSLDLFDDLDQRDSPEQPSQDPQAYVAAGRGFHGVRGIARLTHRTEGSAGFFAIDGVSATDALVFTDTQPYSLERVLDSYRTDVGAWRARGPLAIGADATLLQDTRIINGGAPDRRLFGGEARPTFQRAPALFAQVAPVEVASGTLFVEASAAQFEAFKPVTAQERAMGFGPTDLGAAAAPDLAAGDLSRSPALRLDLSPRMAWSSSRAMPLELRLELGARGDAWVMEGHPERDRARAYALVGARASLPLERRYGDALHRIEPGVTVRALSRPLQSGGPPIGDPADAGSASYATSATDAQQGLPPGLGLRTGSGVTAGVPAARRAYDEIDGAAPSTGAVEAVFSLAQSVWRRGGGRFASVNLEQDALFWTSGGPRRLGEAAANFSAAFGPGSLGGALRYDWAGRVVSTIGGGASVHDERGDVVAVQASLLRPSSSERVRAGIDELFSAVRLATGAGELTGSGDLIVTAALPLQLKLVYDLTRLLSSQPLRADLADTTHRATLILETQCHCAGLRFNAIAPMRGTHLIGGVQFTFAIDLKSLGSFATF